MIFTKELLLKGLAGVSLCAGVAGVGIHIYKSGEVKITDPQGQLGLPADCALPTGNSGASTSCTIENANISKINDIKFDGKRGDSTITPSGSLRITIAKSDDADFPHGYKFTLTPSGGSLTINREESAGGNIVIKAGKSADFKVKKTNDGFSLEEAFTLNTLINKLADFTCTNGECQIGTTAISIKQGEHTESKTKNASQTGTPVGKIKVYTGEEDYNKGFKFVIEEGDIDLTGTTGTNVTKLEEFETYEIKKEGTDWVLVRKSKAIDEVKKALGLSTGSSDCPENTGIFECSLGTAEKLKAVNFDGKTGEPTVSDNNYSGIKLKISKTTETNREKFPHGFKFVLESNKEITALAIKANTNTEFKIKKTGEGKGAVLTLEKAWTVGELATKVGLTSCTTGDASTKECSFGESISVYEGTTKKVVGATFATQGKKIRYELDKEGHNQGIKFYIPHSEAADISITGGTTTGTAITTISKETSAGGAPTYEIKEEGGVWYLAKKTTVSG